MEAGIEAGRRWAARIVIEKSAGWGCGVGSRGEVVKWNEILGGHCGTPVEGMLDYGEPVCKRVRHQERGRAGLTIGADRKHDGHGKWYTVIQRE